MTLSPPPTTSTRPSSPPKPPRAPTTPTTTDPAVLDLLGDLTDRVVLDAGCGPGLYVTELLARGAHVIAIDASANMIDLARRHSTGQITLRQHDLTKPLYWLASDSVDICVLALVIHYIDDRITLLRELRRVLRPGGHLIISTSHPTADWLTTEGSYSIRDGSNRSGPAVSRTASGINRCRHGARSSPRPVSRSTRSPNTSPPPTWLALTPSNMKPSPANPASSPTGSPQVAGRTMMPDVPEFDMANTHRRPVIAIVSGPPGSGKSTLAHALATDLGVPAIIRDEVKQGMVAGTAPTGDAGFEDLNIPVLHTFFDVLTVLARAGVSAVAEAAFQDKLWRRTCYSWPSSPKSASSTASRRNRCSTTASPTVPSTTPTGAHTTTPTSSPRSPPAPALPTPSYR